MHRPTYRLRLLQQVVYFSQLVPENEALLRAQAVEFTVVDVEGLYQAEFRHWFSLSTGGSNGVRCVARLTGKNSICRSHGSIASSASRVKQPMQTTRALATRGVASQISSGTLNPTADGRPHSLQISRV